MIFKVSKRAHWYFFLTAVLTVTGTGTLGLPLQSLAAPASPKGGQNDIVFTATLDKTEYTGEEPINLAFVLKNRGKSPVYVNKRFYFGSEETPRNQKKVNETITRPSGRKLPTKFP